MEAGPGREEEEEGGVGFWGGAAGEGVAWAEEGVRTEEVVGGGGWGIGPGDGVISSSVYSRASVA